MFETAPSPVLVSHKRRPGGTLAASRQSENAIRSGPQIVAPSSPLKGHAYLLLTGERGLLAASCWCERAIVAVTRSDVLAGRTGSCSRPMCAAPEQKSNVG
jgi:hypothetical protein